MNIHKLKEKIKAIWERLNTMETYTVALIVLVGLSSFGLGRLSKLEEVRVPIRIGQQSASTLFSQPPLEGGDRGVVAKVKDKGLTIKDSAVLTAGGQLVASRNGDKYHFPWCSGAQRIAEANKIWFSSIEEARKAGYTLASNCKGLK